MVDKTVWIKPVGVKKKIANRLRAIRRKQKISQEQLWYMSGVSLGSIKRFESTGDISFDALIKIATSLGMIKEIEELFKNKNNE